MKEWTLLFNIANSSYHFKIHGGMERRLYQEGNLYGSGFLLENPCMYQWLEFRMKSVTSFFKEIYESVKNAKSNVEFRYNSCYQYPELTGVCLSSIRDYVDSFRESDYSEQSGNNNGLEFKKSKILKVRSGIGHDKDLIAALGVRPGATADTIKSSLRVISDLGIDGISLGHYDGAKFEILDAVKQGMKEAGMILKSR